MSFRRLLISSTLFVAALISTAALLRPSWGEPYVPLISEKLELFRERKDEWTVLFFGSSRVYRQISPRIFDANLGNHGIENSSLNLGIPAMRFVELHGFIERVLDEKPAALRWVFIDPALFVSLIAEENTRTARAIAWHDFESYRRALISLHCCGAFFDGGGRWQLIGRHSEAFLLRQLGVGSAAQSFERVSLRQRKVRREEARGPDDDGFMPLSADSEDPSTRRAEFLAGLDTYRRDLRRARRTSRRRAGLDDSAAKMLADLVQVVESHGIQPIFVMPPALNDLTPQILEAQRRGIVGHVFEFSNPLHSAQLYAVKFRYDEGHLNAEGAQVFTRILARRFARRLQNGRISELPMVEGAS